LLTLVVGLSSACFPKAEPPPTSPAPAVEVGLERNDSAVDAEGKRLPLWQAVIGESTVFLLGSVHVARAGLYPLAAPIEEAFAGSDVLALELVLDEGAKMEAARRLVELARLPAGVRLPDVVAPETLRRVEAALAQRGGSLLGLLGFHPWFVALTLTTSALGEAGFSAEEGIDEYFRVRAGASKRLVSLETIETQTDIFEGLSPQIEERMLRESVEELDQQAAELERAFEAWKSGDSDALDVQLLQPMREEQPELFDALFVRRNRQMTGTLMELARSPARYFVVVGAGHLVGPLGMVDLLRKRGIVVSQLTAPARP
jgi:uncharacterized protein YbaP (TraB family)